MGGGRLRARTKAPASAPISRSAVARTLAAPTPLLVSPLEGGRDEFWGERWWEMGRSEWATTVFRVGFFGVFGGDSGGWSYLVGAFGGVRVCSDLFRVVQVCSGCGGGVDNGVDGMAGAVAIVLCFAGVWGWGGG